MNPPPSIGAMPATPCAAPRVDIRAAVASLGCLAGRGHVGTQTLGSVLRDLRGPTLRLLAYAVGLKVPADQSHAELAARCVPVFRHHFKRDALRLGAAPVPVEPNRAPGAWHRLRV